MGFSGIRHISNNTKYVCVGYSVDFLAFCVNSSKHLKQCVNGSDLTLATPSGGTVELTV